MVIVNVNVNVVGHCKDNINNISNTNVRISIRINVIINVRINVIINVRICIYENEGVYQRVLRSRKYLEKYNSYFLL